LEVSGFCIDVKNLLKMEVMYERNAHNFPLDLASEAALPVAPEAPAA
jgi:hypothetical protein